MSSVLDPWKELNPCALFKKNGKNCSDSVSNALLSEQSCPQLRGAANSRTFARLCRTFSSTVPAAQLKGSVPLTPKPPHAQHSSKSGHMTASVSAKVPICPSKSAWRNVLWNDGFMIKPPKPCTSRAVLWTLSVSWDLCVRRLLSQKPLGSGWCRVTRGATCQETDRAS